MDKTFGQVAAALSDPGKKDAMLAELVSNTEVLEDEHGNKYEIICLKDTTSIPTLIKGSTLSQLPPSVQERFKHVSPANLQPGAMELRLKDCSTFPLRDDDIVVVSFPKTGTHWISNLINFLLKSGPLDGQVSVQPVLTDLYPWPIMEALPSPRIVPTHHTPAYAPSDIFKGKGKVILVVRNPKDAITSLFYHFQKVPPQSPMTLSWNCFIENAMKGKMPFGSYFDFYNKWQKTIEKHPDLKILVMYFEQMKKDPLSELKKMNDFLGLTNDGTRLQQVLDKCSINNLRNDVSAGKVASPHIDKDGKSTLYRKGIIGDWKNHFTVAQNEVMDELIKNKFKDSMFEIIY